MRNIYYGDEDPEVQDDTDPEFEEEMFHTMRAMGWKPEGLRDREFAAKFAEWLKTAPPEV